MTALLAFDTASDRMTIVAARDDRVHAFAGEAGAKASTTLVPAILALLDAAGLALADLDAIGFGRGPGAFTGLRTACSVAQGLAFGADRPVLPLDNLQLVAEAARDEAAEAVVWAVVDARMDEIYAAHYAFAAGRWRTLEAPMLTDAAALSARWRDAPPACVAGDALDTFAARLDVGAATRRPQARVTPAALLSLARMAWHDGRAVDAAAALPLYVRDKVAQTTVERAAVREAKR